MRTTHKCIKVRGMSSPPNLPRDTLANKALRRRTVFLLKQTQKVSYLTLPSYFLWELPLRLILIPTYKTWVFSFHFTRMESHHKHFLF